MMMFCGVLGISFGNFIDKVEPRDGMFAYAFIFV